MAFSEVICLRKLPGMSFPHGVSSEQFFVLVNICLLRVELGEASKGHLEQEEHQWRKLGEMHWLSMLAFTLE